MRLTYLCIPLFALLLAGCGDDEPTRPVDTTTPPVDEPFGTPPGDPADDVLPPNNGNMPPPTTPDDGLGTEYGTDPGSAPPPSDDGMGNPQ